MNEFTPTEPSLKPDPNLIIPKESKPEEKIIPKERLTPDPNFTPTE